MYGLCLPGRPEPLSGSRSASSPIPPSPENRQGYTPPDTVPASKISSPTGHPVSFCILLAPSVRPFHLCRTNCFILSCIKVYGASKGVATTYLRQFSSNFGTLKILTWILSQEYHQPLQKSRHICRILLIWDAFPRRMRRFSILRQKTQNLAPVTTQIVHILLIKSSRYYVSLSVHKCRAE